ncbi:hypothetical protein Adt_11004 [Abeliophyllum distichum]|uniref:Uncharacterized protein n=1 Tax=Abeliophyllum distichum TaxID=126358 RepID=A0ABD1UN55_9LAMI
MGKVSSSSSTEEPTIACPLPPASTSRRKETPVVSPKAKAGKRLRGTGIPEMRGSLDKKDAYAARRLDEELKRLATDASMVCLKITEADLEDIRLFYDVPASVVLRTPDPEEWADYPP